MKLKFIILIYFTTLGFCEVHTDSKINKAITFTGNEKAVITKAAQVQELIKKKSISINEMLKALGQPISYVDLGPLGPTYTYKGGSKLNEIGYFFSESIVNKGDDESFIEITSINICWPGQHELEFLEIWKREVIEK